MGCDQYTVPDRQSPRGRDVFRHYRQPSGDFCQNGQFRQNRQSPRGHFWHPVQFVRGWRFFAIFAIACLFMKCRTYSSCFPLALANIRLWPLVPFFQISLKNTELKTTHNTFGGIVACIFSDNFLNFLEMHLDEYWLCGSHCNGQVVLVFFNLFLRRMSLFFSIGVTDFPIIIQLDLFYESGGGSWI